MSNKRLRPPPSYQEYPSDLLANRHYSLMSLSERGLFDIMRKQCWVNYSVPTNKADLAKIIRCQPDEVEANLTPNVLHFFVEKNGEYVSPELDDYRFNQEERRRKLAEGGKKGGESTQSKNQARLKGKLKPLSSGEGGVEEQGGKEIESLESEVSKITLSEESAAWVEDYNRAEPI